MDLGRILHWVEVLGAETVVSFDAGGVSGHRNHVGVAKALQALYGAGRLPSGTAVFVLDSVWLLRKYAGPSFAFLDIEGLGRLEISL